MTPGEAWTLAPCELTRWLKVRGDHHIDDRLQLGVIMAQAFNKPSSIGDQIRERAQARLAGDRPSAGDELVAMFQVSGVPVLDETREGAR